MDIKSFFKNIVKSIRYTKKRYHLIETELDEYQYYDIDIRMLYGMFSLLKEFVEIEGAHMFESIYSPEGDTNYTDELKGIEYLRKLADTYKENNQSCDWISEVQYLYFWWTKERPNRVLPEDKYSALDFDCVYNSDFGIYTSKKYYALITEMDETYYQEDTEMLCRLVKIRRYLWT